MGGVHKFGVVFDEAFKRICGPLAHFDDAHTGLPADASRAERGRRFRRLRRGGELESYQRLAPSETPWYDSQRVAIDYEALQCYCLAWRAHRERGTTVLLVAHDAAAVDGVDQKLTLEKGGLVT